MGASAGGWDGAGGAKAAEAPRWVPRQVDGTEGEGGVQGGLRHTPTLSITACLLTAPLTATLPNSPYCILTAPLTVPLPNSPLLPPYCTPDCAPPPSPTLAACPTRPWQRRCLRPDERHPGPGGWLAAWQ